MIHNPAVLFADEPVSNLDAQNKKAMLDLFKLWRGNDLNLPPLAGHKENGSSRTLILICHEIETAWEMGEWFLFLEPPRDEALPGATAELLEREKLNGMEALRQRVARPERD